MKNSSSGRKKKKKNKKNKKRKKNNSQSYHFNPQQAATGPNHQLDPGQGNQPAHNRNQGLYPGQEHQGHTSNVLSPKMGSSVSKALGLQQQNNPQVQGDPDVATHNTSTTHGTIPNVHTRQSCPGAYLPPIPYHSDYLMTSQIDNRSIYSSAKPVPRESPLRVNQYEDQKNKKFIEQLQREIAEKEYTIEHKDRKIAEKEHTIADKDRKIAEKEHTIADKDRKIAEKEDIIKQYAWSNNQYEKSNQSLHEEKQRLKASYEKMRQELQEMSIRLAGEMSQKVASNESSVENVSIRNRPMNVAEDYQLLMSDQWLDAKQTLDNLLPGATEQIKLEVLCTILLISEIECKDLHVDVMERTNSYLSQLPIYQPVEAILGGQRPQSEGGERRTVWANKSKGRNKQTGQVQKRSRTPEAGNRYKKQRLDVPPLQLTNVVRDILRSNCDSVDFSSLIQKVKDRCTIELHHDIWRVIEQEKTINSYISACVGVVWKMVLQTPSMTLSTEGIGRPHMGDKYQDVMWGSDNPSDKKSRVVCYANPMLYHGNTLMAKGRVLILKEEKQVKRSNRTISTVV